MGPLSLRASDLQLGLCTDAARQACCALAGFPTLSVQTEVGVYFVLNYSAHNWRGAAWKHMSFCLGIIDTKAGKYLLDRSAYRRQSHEAKWFHQEESVDSRGKVQGLSPEERQI